jgi:hypothetical protein
MSPIIRSCYSLAVLSSTVQIQQVTYLDLTSVVLTSLLNHGQRSFLDGRISIVYYVLPCNLVMM